MAAANAQLLQLSDAEGKVLESWLIEFDRSWHEGRLADRARELPAPGNRLRFPALVELVKIDLEKQWKRGRQVGLEFYLKSLPELGTPDSVPTDLIQAEYEVRLQFGAAPDLAGFAKRFPRRMGELQQLLQKAREVVSDAELAHPSHPTVGPRPSTQSQLRPSGAPGALPERFGRYRIVKQLGKGGMGAVYLAEDTQLQRQVALKVPHFNSEDGAELLERFYREARAAATLEHPNLCPVHDVGAIDGIHYLTMAYIEGKTLADFIKASKPLSQRDVAGVVRKLALALHEAHAKGVIHRDLKPANIMINRRREPVIMDFGLARRVNKDDARLTQSGMVMGTPAYMPPEQVSGDLQAMGAGCDIYSLGVILYELLTGRLPFKGNMAVIMSQILTQEPEPPSQQRLDLEPQLEAICMKAIKKKPSERYASMGEMAAALTGFLRAAGPTSSAPLKDTPKDTAEQVFAEMAAEPRLHPLRPPARPKGTGWRGRVPVWGWVAAAAAPLLLLLGGIVIYIDTDNGRIKIELSDPNAQVEIKVDGNTVSLTGLEDPLKLTVGPHGLTITGKNFQTLSQSFTVKKGNNPVLRVELVPKQALAGAVPSGPATKPEPPKPPAGQPVAAAPGKDAATEVVLALIEKLGGKSRQDHSLPTKPIIEVNLLSSTVRDADLQALSGLTHLQVLTLGNTRISDAGMAHLKGLTSLERLDLGTTDITNAGLVHLKGMTRMQRLELFRTTIDDAGLAPLSGSSELRILGLEGTRVGDAGLAHLKGLTKLEALNLSGTKVSDAGLEHLNGLMNLREFHAQGTQVTEAGKKRLQAIWTAARSGTPPVASPAEALRAGRIKAPDLSKARVLHNDEFDDPKSGFPVSAAPDLTRSYQAGKYVIRRTGSGWTPGPWKNLGDCACLCVGRVRGGAENIWGIEFNNDQRKLGVGVYLTGRGELRLHPTYTQGLGKFPPPYRDDIPHPAIKPGEQLNTILAVVRGRTIEVYVNDVAVCEPMTVDFEFLPCSLDLLGGIGDTGAAEFERVTVYSTDGLPTLADRLAKGEVPAGTPPAVPQASPQGKKADYDAIATGKWLPVLRTEEELKEATGMRFENGILVSELPANRVAIGKQPASDVIIRAKVKNVTGNVRGMLGMGLRKRTREDKSDGYIAWFNGGDWFGIGVGRSGTNTDVANFRTGRNYDDYFELAFSAVGNELTMYADGKAISQVRHSDFKAGYATIFAGKGSLFKDVEIMILDKPSAGAKEITNSIGMTLALIPAGKFIMGSPPTERGRSNEEVPHEVEITRPFHLGAFEVTQEQYERVMGLNPSAFTLAKLAMDTKRFPVENVSWEEAREFCRKLAALPDERQAGRTYRLPTEAEWEYACRGGSAVSQPFYFDQPRASITAADAILFRNLGMRTTQVGSYKPNAFGLYDMHGSLWEWCSDWYDKDYYKSSPRQDPAGPGASPDNGRVLRGGSWTDGDFNCRAATRAGSSGDRTDRWGFRVVCVHSGGSSESPPAVPLPKLPMPGAALPSKHTNTLGMEFALVPKGKAWLGGRDGKPGDKEVELPQDFYLGVYEVTQEEWQKVMGTNPSKFARAGGAGGIGVFDQSDAAVKRFPVNHVSWFDCREFVKRLNEQLKENGWEYRLPTEAEWEYACRGGPVQSKDVYGFNYYAGEPANRLLPDRANFSETGLKRPCKVGSYPANRLGLYDMHGNIAEWCNDEKVPPDASGKEARVNRGGSWWENADYCKPTWRSRWAPATGYGHVGLRVARVPVGRESTPPNAGGFQTLFNGTDLTAWGGLMQQWSLKDGILTGSNLPQGLQHHTFLCSKRRYRDFELRFQVRLSGGGQANSGLNIRSEVLDGQKFTVSGLQCDIGGKFWGSLSSESIPGRPSTAIKLAPDAVVAKVKGDDFNDFHIRCVGKHVTIRLNGEVTVDDDFPYMPDEGIIAWQIHRNPTEVTFRNVELNELGTRQLAAGAKEITNSIGMKLALIPSGEFMMGARDDEAGARDWERPRHRVRISKPFHMGVYPVTQQEYERVMGSNPSYFSRKGPLEERRDKVAGMDTSRFPVENVSWLDAVAFCKKLTALPEEKGRGAVYRLPTEAEWEYACRAGTTTIFWFGDSISADQANFDTRTPYGQGTEGPYLERTTRVDAYKPNPFGLYDMHGNVWNWCQDVYARDFYGLSPADDPVNHGSGGQPRVHRGGGYHNAGVWCRAAQRTGQKPDATYPNVGFRVVWEVAPPTQPPAAAPAPPRPAPQAWLPLFNGKDLTGWKKHPTDKSRWEVKNGILTGSGDRGLLYSERGDYENFHFRVEARINATGNSGQYFRTEYGPSSPTFPRGYEAQISTAQGDQKTGSLYGLVKIPLQLHRPGDWFSQEVIAQGNHITILVNNQKVVDFRDPLNTYTKGYLALQQNAPGSAVEFRKIEIKELKAP